MPGQKRVFALDVPGIHASTTLVMPGLVPGIHAFLSLAVVK
jgi:hypothetical protein